MATTSQLPVLIIGAGITGLLVAQGLKQASIPFRIFDSEPSINARTREWTVGIHWSIPDLLSLLPEPLHRRLRETYGDPFHKYSKEKPPRMPLLNLETGEVLKVVEFPDMLRVSRGRMRALCGVGIDVAYEKEFMGLVLEHGEGMIAKFAGGEEVRGLCIIGADGPHSAVRRSLLGAKGNVVPGGVTQYSALVKYKDAETARRVRDVDEMNAIGYHPKGLVYFQAIQNVIVPDDPNTWTYQILVMWKGDQSSTRNEQGREDNAAKLTAMKKGCANLAEPFLSAVEKIPDETETWHDKIHYWLPQPWENHRGRVTLAGDAAHPMMPYRGQGLNHSIRDAALLVSAIVSNQNKLETLENAIKKYEEEMFPRAVAEVNSSLENTQLILDWDRLMESPIFRFGAARTS